MTDAWTMTIRLASDGSGLTVTLPDQPYPVFGALSSLALPQGQEIVPIETAAAFVAPSGTPIYTAIGLPEGLTINPSTGEITGAPTELQPARTVTISVAVGDAANAARASFVM
ncbi:MAG: Ig domain-containing protein, partial [Pseudomonadota bacterium]